MLLLWSIFPALDAFLELCDHPESHRLQQTLRSPANSAAKLDLPSGEATITERAELKQVEEGLAIGANVVYETIRHQGEELRRTASALAWSAFAGQVVLPDYCEIHLLGNLHHAVLHSDVAGQCHRWILTGGRPGPCTGRWREGRAHESQSLEVGQRTAFSGGYLRAVSGI
jgi:hypothetical protein